MPLFITQTKAVQTLRKATGKSEAWCEQTVKQLPKVPDGKRLKVKERDVTNVIANLDNKVQITAINRRWM